MAKRMRGRPPRGEYPGKTAVMNFRIRPDTKRLLEAAARASGRTLSQETEHQLRRALVDMGVGPTFALMKVIGSAIDAIISTRYSRGNPNWIDDPYLFDQVAKAITGAFEIFRPAGVITRPADVLHGSAIAAKAEGQAAALQLLALIRSADVLTPISRQSAQTRALTVMKQDLGALLDRPVSRTRDEIVSNALGEFKSQRGVIDKARTDPDAITPDEALILWRIAGEMASTTQPVKKGRS
jgi:hypothetical protein